MSAKNKLVILEKKAIENKLNRLACQILENHSTAIKLQFIGLNERGYKLSQEIKKRILKLDKQKSIEIIQGFTEGKTRIDKKEDLNPKLPIVIMDDVLNTGRSIYFLLSDLASIQPANVQICVLADRHHKKYPIHADFVGLTFATTIQEHIYFDIDKPELYLE